LATSEEKIDESKNNDDLVANIQGFIDKNIFQKDIKNPKEITLKIQNSK